MIFILLFFRMSGNLFVVYDDDMIISRWSRIMRGQRDMCGRINHQP